MSFIEYEASERIATITLNRPEAANAQTLELLDDLDLAWRRAAEDPEVRMIVLQSNGKHFSAGHDIKGVAAEIATKHPFALRQAKRAVNQTLDVMGFYAAVQSLFDIHQTGHGHAISESGMPILMMLEDMNAELARPRAGEKS